MAHSSAKKLFRANEKRLRTLFLAIVLANILYAVPFFTAKAIPSFHRVLWPIFLVIYFLTYGFLWSSARPTYVNGELVDAGHNIVSPGVMEYVHDILFLTMFIQLGQVFTRYSLLLFLVVPATAVYLLVSMKGKMSGALNMPQPEADDNAPVGRKDRRKAQRAAKKQR